MSARAKFDAAMAECALHASVGFAPASKPRRRPDAIHYTRQCPIPFWPLRMHFTAVFQQVPEGFIGFVEELPGANAQGDTLDEARENLTEAVAMVLEAHRALAEESLQGKVVIREALVLA